MNACMRPLLISLALLLLAAGAAAAPGPVPPDKGGILKWVDDKGLTHYGDTIPPEYANRSSTLLNKSGRIMRQSETVKPAAQQAPAAEQEKLLSDQQHHDAVLLGSYTNEQEIDLARERSTQMDEAAIKGLEQGMEAVKARLAMHQKSAAGFTVRKKPVPEDLKKDLDDASGELGRIEAQIRQKRLDIEATQQRFDHDKQHFHELKQIAPKPAAPR